MAEKTSKKIILIGTAYPYRGGNGVFISYVYHTLKEHFETKIFNYKLLYPSLLFPGTTQFDVSEKPVMKAPSERLVNSINPFNWYSVAQRLKRENADLIVFNWWHPFFAFCHFFISFFIRKQYKGKILFITENFISHEANFVDRLLTHWGLSNADKFLALSNEVEKELHTINNGRPVYRSELPVFDCYNFGDESKKDEILKEAGFSADDKVLLFLGYVREYKGVDVLIDAMPGLLEWNPSVKLLVVGEFYDSPDKYFQQVKRLGLEGRVHFVNQYVPNEVVGSYYGASDVVVLPYRSATQSGILNMAYGFFKPAIVTRVGGLEEFVDDEKTGVIVEPGSADELIRGVKKFYELKETTDFAENIRKRVSESSFTKLPSLFENILNDEAPSQQAPPQ